MNEAQTEKQNSRRKQLKAIIAGYMLIMPLTFGTYAYLKENEHNKLVSTQKETMHKLDETQKKVEIQNENIKKLAEENKELQTTVESRTQELVDMKDNLQKSEAEKLDLQEDKKDLQGQVRKLDADLKKKRASRAKTSAVPVVSTVKVQASEPKSEPQRVQAATRKVVSSKSTSGQAFRSTAYFYGTKTASGTRPQEGRTIAVDPNVIPLGSQVRVTCPEYPSVNGVYTAEDTGGVIKGNIIDIYMQDKSRALDFGRRTLYVEVL